MVFPEDAVMVALAGLVVGSVRDGESQTTLRLTDGKRVCDIALDTQAIEELEARGWVMVDDVAGALRATDSGAYAVRRWLKKRIKVGV